MALSTQQREEISELLNRKVSEKLRKYSRETASMPFLTRLIQDSEKVAAYSFIHSVATTLGMSIYEQISVIIAKDKADECFRNYDIGGVLSREQKVTIESIVQNLRDGIRKVNHEQEVKEVLAASTTNAKAQKDGRIADFYMLRGGKEYYFEIKTAKPNIDVFTKSKTKLLEWVARKRKPVYVYLASPYNPYDPQPYERFTEQGLLERNKEFIIGEEYWDFLGGKATYVHLLELFDYIGKSFRLKIQKKIQEVAEKKIEKYKD